jgi:hypothetical protein
VNLLLPSVNWYPPLKKFDTPFFKKYNLHYQSVLLAIRHCEHSTSLVEFLIYALNGFPEILIREEDGSNDMEYKKLLVGEGLGKILELCGFEGKKKSDQIIKLRGIENIMKKVAIPNSRIFKIINEIITCLFGNSEKLRNPNIEVNLFLKKFNLYFL